MSIWTYIIAAVVVVIVVIIAWKLYSAQKSGSSAASTIQNAIGNAVNWFSKAISNGFNSVVGGLSNDLKGADQALSNTVNSIGKDFGIATSGFVKGASGLGASISKGFSSAGTDVQGIWNSLANMSAGEAQTIIQGSTIVGMSAERAAMQFEKGASLSIANALNGIRSTVLRGTVQVNSVSASGLRDLYSFGARVPQQFQQVQGGASEAISALTKAISPTGQTIAQAAQTAGVTVEQAAASTGSAVTKSIENAFNYLASVRLP